MLLCPRPSALVFCPHLPPCLASCCPHVRARNMEKITAPVNSNVYLHAEGVHAGDAGTARAGAGGARAPARRGNAALLAQGVHRHHAQGDPRVRGRGAAAGRDREQSDRGARAVPGYVQVLPRGRYCARHAAHHGRVGHLGGVRGPAVPPAARLGHRFLQRRQVLLPAQRAGLRGRQRGHRDAEGGTDGHRVDVRVPREHK
nr:MAG: hypothetical protein [Molluscum contagiosum virus]